MSEREVIERTPEPNTVGTLSRDLAALGVEPGMLLLVHSSLSALGWTVGGAVTVVLALEAAVRAYGTLIMPTQSGDLSDPEEWEHPPVPKAWWETIRREMPAFHPEMTPSRGMGAVPECFRTQPGVVRSVHPHDSFAAWGEHAVEICSDHELDFGLGEGSPLRRIYDHDGWVLLLGCGFESNTSFHLAEYRADYGRKEVVWRYAPIEVDGHRRWKQFRDINIDSDDFVELGRDFHKQRSADVREGRVGGANALLFPQRSCVDYAVRWLRRHRAA